MIIQLSVAARKAEAVFTVGQPAFSYTVYLSGIYHHVYVHRNVQLIAAFQNFLPHAIPLPCVPIGYVRKFRLSFLCFHKSVFRKCIALAAGIAQYICSTGFHGALRTAVRAFVQHAVQPLGAERFAYFNVVLLLPFEVVEGELLGKYNVYILGRLCPYVLRRKYVAYIRRYVYLAQPQTVIERIPREGAVGAYHHHRHSHEFDALAQARRQRRSGTVKCIACLGIHKYGAFQLFQCKHHIPYQLGIRYELAGRYAAQASHKPLLAHKAIGCTDNI